MAVGIENRGPRCSAGTIYRIWLLMRGGVLNNVQVPGLCDKWKGISRGEQFGAIDDEFIYP